MRNSWLYLSLAATIVMLTGCGQAQATNAKQASHSKDTVIHALPTSVSAKLSDVKTRIHTVKTFPVHKGIKGNAILFIAPNEAYAIKQFKRVWPHLKSLPTVVWTGTTKTNAKTVWMKEGYSKKPLPSSHTYYIFTAPPTPDAYAHKNKGWSEIPGVLKPNQTNAWITFFSTHH